MKVYIVTQSDYECANMVGVFASREEAERNIQTREGWGDDHDFGASNLPATITEWEIGKTERGQRWNVEHTNPPVEQVTP